jgi:hypothetical protein
MAMTSRAPSSVDLTEAWRAGFSGGTLGTRPPPHQLAAVGVALGLLLLMRRGLHPFLLAATVALLAVSLPLLALALAVELTVRQHRQWRDWARTCCIAATWLVWAGLLLGTAVGGWPVGLLLLVALAPAGWKVESCNRGRRAAEDPVDGPEDLYAREWARGYRDGSAVIGGRGIVGPGTPG